MLLGAVADDLTGATDLALMLALTFLFPRAAFKMNWNPNSAIPPHAH